MKQKILDHLFIYVLVVLIGIAGIFSYHRFMINRDYMVGYEGVCDPAVNLNKCFEGCDDDDCIQKHYYVKMVKYAPDLYNECGEDITDCESANMCLPDDRDCSVVYCDSEVEQANCAIEVDTQINDDANVNTEESSQDNE